MTSREGVWDGAPPSDRASPSIAALHRHWQSLRGDRRMPARGHLDIQALRPWLGWLIIWDVLRDEAGTVADFRYRLVGTGVARLSSADLTGRRVSECAYTDGVGRTMTNLREIAEGGQPRYRSDRHTVSGGFLRSGERLFLPLSDDGATVSHVLAFIQANDYEELVPRDARPNASPSLI